MAWKESHLVTVKRLHTNESGGCVDLLIDELKFLRFDLSTFYVSRY